MTPGGSSPLFLKLLMLSLLSVIVQGQSDFTGSTVQALNKTEFHSRTNRTTTTTPSNITTATTTPSPTTAPTTTTATTSTAATTAISTAAAATRLNATKDTPFTTTTTITTTTPTTTPTTVTTVTPSTATTTITTTPTTPRTIRGPSISENAEGKNIYKLRDNDGNIFKVFNFTGCHWTVPGADIQCPERSYIAAIRNIFYFINPQIISQCSLCSGLTDGCYDTCCNRNEANECIYYEDPTKDLIARVQSCSVTSFCHQQTYGWTHLDPGYRRCFHDIVPRQTIYSQTAELQYICVKGDWELLMTHETFKSGSVLFLNSFRDNHFNPSKIGFNLSCTLSAEDSRTIEITALDLRLCSDFNAASNSRPCGQKMIITEPQNQPYVIEVTSNDDQGYLGLKRVYQSKTKQVTIQVQSDGIESSFNVWLYVEPSGGKITGTCSAPILFTTTTTTTTTTAPSTATSKSTRRRVTSTVSSPTSTKVILFGTTTKADGGVAAGEHYVNQDASSQLDQVLIYEKISVTGVWATFLIIFIFLIWAYRKLRAKSKQFVLGQTQKHHEVPQAIRTKANLYAPAPFTNSAYEPGRERTSRHGYTVNRPGDVTRPPLPPPQSKARIYEKTPSSSAPPRGRAPDPRPRDTTASRQSERTSSSVQGARMVLVDLVIQEVKSDPEIEKALRSTSSDVRSAIEAMDTKTLRQTYDDIQRMKRDRNSTYDTVRH